MAEIARQLALLPQPAGPVITTVPDAIRIARYQGAKQSFEEQSLAGELHIRAIAGHSMPRISNAAIHHVLRWPNDADHLVPVCTHGTKRQHVRSILDHGLEVFIMFRVQTIGEHWVLQSGKMVAVERIVRDKCSRKTCIGKISRRRIARSRKLVRRQPGSE